MKKLILFVLIFLLSTTAWGAEFCARTQEDLKTLLTEQSSRIAFKNTGGLFNQGVCWWHNRLQRSSAYLAIYNPHVPRPSTTEALNIIRELRQMNRVVVIPGYKDFETFSLDYKNEIQKVLNEWQKVDGFYNFEWRRGISGRSSLPSQQMNLRMIDVYTHYKNSPTPLWIMAQIKGLTSHSFMILRMKEIQDGYVMQVIDSNNPLKTLAITYLKGDTSLKGPGGKYTFVPYVGFQNDFKKISAALQKSCLNVNSLINLDWMREGEIER